MKRKSWHSRQQASISKSNGTATTTEDTICSNSNNYDSKNMKSDYTQDNDEWNSTGSEASYDYHDDSCFPDGHQVGERRRMDDLLDKLRSGKNLHGSGRLRHRGQKNATRASLETLQNSTSSTAPGVLSLASSPSTTSLDDNDCDDVCFLSAEDLLRDLQNDD